MLNIGCNDMIARAEQTMNHCVETVGAIKRETYFFRSARPQDFGCQLAALIDIRLYLDRFSIGPPADRCTAVAIVFIDGGVNCLRLGIAGRRVIQIDQLLVHESFTVRKEPARSASDGIHGTIGLDETGGIDFVPLFFGSDALFHGVDDFRIRCVCTEEFADIGLIQTEKAVS